MNGEKPGTLAGGVDGLKPGYVYGWAWRPNDPFEKVEVELLADGEVVAEATACLTRLDLGAAGIGNGQHGFELPFTIAPDSPPVIHMIVRAKNGPTLHNGEFDLQTDGEQIADLAASQTVAQLEQVFGAVTLTSTPAPRPQPSAPAPKLNFVLHAANADRVRAGLLGMAEYSYVFVMNGFAEVLRRLGTVHLAPELAQVDAIFDACLARGEACMLFSFAPPQRTPLGLRCPTIPVIAWEYGTIPTGGWPGDAREDWRLVLRQTGRAIAISDFAARALRAGMGADYPVAFVPTPVWDRLHSLRRTTSAARSGPTRLALEGFAWDSQTEAVPTGDRPPPPPPRNRTAPRAKAGKATPRSPATEPVPGKTFRRRLRISASLARQWYREVARDVLPSPVVRVASLTGRIAVTALQTWQATARPNPVAPARAAASHSPVAAAAPPHVTAPYLPVDPSAKITAAPRPPRYRPAPDIAPLPEPALAVFEPNPVLEQPQPQGTQGIRIDGTVFTAVLAPRDGRKNWPNILTAFTTAFADTPSATLVLKMIGEDASFWWWELHRIVKALPPFACRVVVLSGYLAEPEYQALIACTHFVVNASLAEGQCLPLVEFMSGHCPAIAPRHTAMLDYVGPENAIIVESSVEFCAWPHDPRNHLTTTRHRVEWQSLCDAFALAWRIFHQDPARYAAMSKAAAASVRGYCADAVVGPRLASFLGLGDEAVLRAGWRPLPRAAAEPLLEPAPAPLRPDRAGTTA